MPKGRKYSGSSLIGRENRRKKGGVPMDHREYIRTVDGSPVGVLMIHGILGTPAHFRDLLPVIPGEWSVHNLLLDGHDGRPEDLGASSMEKWKAQVNAALDDLMARHEKVLILAHSMGTLFAIRAAIAHPERVRALFLLAVPLRPWIRPSTLLTCLRLVRGTVRPDDAPAAAMRDSTALQLERSLRKYLCLLPRYRELLTEIRRVRKLVPQLTVPCQAFQSRVDEEVSFRSCKDLAKNPLIRVSVLYDSGHFSYGEGDIALLRSRLRETVEQLRF